MKKGLPAWLWESIIVAILIAVGFFDWQTGYELDFLLFYFLPVLLGAWFLGLRTSLILAVACSIVWAGLDVLSGHGYTSYIYLIWNTLIRLVSFLAIGWSVYKIRALLVHEREIAAELHKKNKELEDANAAITQLMRTDALTGLANRHYFLEVLENIMSLSKRHQTPLSLVMADLDHFKTINDTYGHAAGDQVLKHFGALLKKYSRREDLAARFGGEEFIVALPLTDLSGAKIFAKKIRYDLEEMKWDQIKSKVTGSFGVSQFQTDDTPDSFIERADKALYQAKATGRNRVMIG